MLVAFCHFVPLLRTLRVLSPGALVMPLRPRSCRILEGDS